MNQLNKSLQDPGVNVLLSSDKFMGFKRKSNLRKNHVVKRHGEMFPLLLGLESEKEYQQVSSPFDDHLEELRNKIQRSFPPL
jgi:hypothetical protein